MPSFRTIFLLVLMVFVIAACDSGGAANSNSDSDTGTGDTPVQQQADVSPDALPAYDLAQGAYTLNISGAIEGGTGYSGTRSTIVDYNPYGRATNSEGAMDVTMRWDGTYNGTAYDVAIVIILRDGIGTGTHTIGDSISEGSGFDVRGNVDVDDFGVQDFGKNVSGTLTLDSANRQYANGTFQFSAENNAGERVEVSGSFHAIPFSRDAERDFTFSGVLAENPPNQTGIAWNMLQEEGFYDIHFDYATTRLILYIPLDAAVGTYEVGAESAVRADWDYNYPATGTLELTEDGEFYSGSLNLTFTTDEGESTISGTFEAIPRSEN